METEITEVPRVGVSTDIYQDGSHPERKADGCIETYVKL